MAMITYQTITFDFNLQTEKDTVATTTFSVDQGYQITREEEDNTVELTHIGVAAVVEETLGVKRTTRPRIEPRGDSYSIPWARVQVAVTITQQLAFEAFEKAKRDKAAGIALQPVKK